MPTAHLFVRVVDHFGDAGIAWVLGLALAQDYGFDVTIIIDDPAPLAKIAPDYKNTNNINVLTDIPATLPPANLIIEMLSAAAPDDYVARAAACTPTPTWIIYEYLSAEDWITDLHLKPSPHPTLNLPRTFFYPGFTADTGGLLYREQDFPETKPTLAAPSRSLKIGLFCYKNPQLPALLNAWQTGDHTIDLYVPDQAITPTITEFFAQNPNQDPLDHHSRPFMPRDEFITYLADNDLNFVRGEESFASALLTGKPLIWHIYYQEQNAHLVKLKAFCTWFTASLAPPAAAAYTNLTLAWNGFGDIAAAWATFIPHLPTLAAHAQNVARTLKSHGSAAKNLVDFYRQR